MQSVKTTLATLTLAAVGTFAGCLGSPTPRYAGPPKRNAAYVASSVAAVRSASSAPVRSNTRVSENYRGSWFDQENDPYLDLWNADKPFLLPRPAAPKRSEEQQAPRASPGEKYMQFKNLPHGDWY